MRICECESRTSTLERVGEGSSPRISCLAGLDQAEGFRGVDAERLQHFGRENLANAALEGEPPVAPARPGRLPAALRAEIEQPPVLGVAQLREEKAAAVAEIGIVRAKLMAVIAQRQRLDEAARQGFEAAEMGDPFGVGQRVEPDPRGGALVAVAQDVLGKGRGRDLIEKPLAKRRV